MMIRHPQYGVLEASVELRGGTTDRIVTITDMRVAELGIAFAADGRLRIRIDRCLRCLPLADAAKAQELSKAGHPHGKLILHP
ncbi:hypothetical protein JL475_35255 [Streptomyces sp. M2CJ-2]|nr:hypothetical protein [Streptomyces sp. M2CJ-2]MBL3671102.1 hypothetical protein [Streptomyces sp. M2CJ-2]